MPMNRRYFIAAAATPPSRHYAGTLLPPADYVTYTPGCY